MDNESHGENFVEFFRFEKSTKCSGVSSGTHKNVLVKVCIPLSLL